MIIELKVGAFRPKYSGKPNFYLLVVDDRLRDPAVDQPCSGILLCRETNRVIAEYALRDMTKPMAVTTYLTRSLPEAMRDVLPAVEVIEKSFVNATLTGRYGICVKSDMEGRYNIEKGEK